MSLNALPTELDERLLDYLNHKELSAISKVSKYYRRFAEPHLYRRIHFPADRNINARWLLLTLLSRNDLTVHIRQLTVEKGPPPTTSRRQWSGEPNKRMEQALGALQRSITTVIGTNESFAGIRTTWLGNILAEHFLEGTFTLIACLALNIETLSFTTNAVIGDPNGGSFFSKMLAEVASRSPKRGGHLSKLRKLVLQSRTHIKLPRLASLRTIKLIDIKSVSYPQPDSSMPVSTKLRKIEMVHTFGLTFLSNFLHRDRLPHLKTLVFHDRFGFSGTDYQRVIVKLQKECPKLKYLKLTIDNYRHLRRPVKLKGLQALASLETLCIDLDFLLERNRWGQLLDSGAVLPPNLTRLDISHIDFMDIGFFMTQGDTDVTVTPRPFFVNGPPLEKFSLSVGSTYVASDKSNMMLATIANNLRAQDVEFQVYRSAIARSGERVMQALI